VGFYQWVSSGLVLCEFRGSILGLSLCARDFARVLWTCRLCAAEMKQANARSHAHQVSLNLTDGAREKEAEGTREKLLPSGTLLTLAAFNEGGREMRSPSGPDSPSTMPPAAICFHTPRKRQPTHSGIRTQEHYLSSRETLLEFVCRLYKMHPVSARTSARIAAGTITMRIFHSCVIQGCAVAVLEPPSV
jgi:hypothetical protein